MNNHQNGFESGSPRVSLRDTSRRIYRSIWRTYGNRELYEYMLPEGSRIVAGNVFVKGEGKKLVCLGTSKEVCEKGLRGVWK